MNKPVTIELPERLVERVEAARLAADETLAFFARKRAGADPARLRAFLQRAGGAPPAAEDALLEE